MKELINKQSVIGTGIGIALGIYFGNQEKKVLEYAIYFGIFGFLMGTIAKNIIPDKATKTV